MTIGKEKKVACNSMKLENSYASSEAKKFTLIRNKKENLKDLIGGLANKSYGQVMSTTEKVLKYISDVYSEYKGDNGVKKQFKLPRVFSWVLNEF